MLQRIWGYDTLRPLQAEAIDAALAGREALVVLPTGAGKSLCYQLPALVTGKLTVVVSPLIALMKDQADGLRLAGYPAAALHSQLEAAEAREAMDLLDSGELRLLLVAPERLLTSGTLARLARRADRIGAFAIDEAHCISHWGHDFRPEYRRLAELREVFPGVPMQAYTATATPRVRDDICRQLRLQDPEIIVGPVDRPNLNYRIVARARAADQVAEAVARMGPGAAIVYCISRKDTERMAQALTSRGHEAEAYHAGLSARDRRRIQDRFSREQLNIVCATVAFGMGIDRSDVRLVCHAAMPKSVESYQQESGRAGRDGLPAECLMLYSGADATKWRELIRLSAAESGGDEAALAAQMELIDQMQAFCARFRCRHRGLVEHFGQEYVPAGGVPPHSVGAPPGRMDSCGACDVCLGEVQPIPDSTTIARKILSAVARTDQRFGAAHIADVLRGRANDRITERRHNELSVFGLLRNCSKADITAWIGQLVDQGVLARVGVEYPVIALGPHGLETLRGQREAKLISVSRPKRGGGSPGARQSADAAPLAPKDEAMFEALRALRRRIAEEGGVPPYVIFTDATLREMARRRPRTLAAMLEIKGVGDQKLRQLGPAFLEAIAQHQGDAPET
ncbi:MAG: RecQ family ATP-dependent DNA helicase [Phycisphaerales bacterium JB039]